MSKKFDVKSARISKTFSETINKSRTMRDIDIRNNT